MLKKTIVFAAFVGLAFTFTTPSPTYAGGICLHHKHAGTGRGPTKNSARKAARAKWRVSVLRHNHNNTNQEKFLKWANSLEQTSSCKKKWGVYKCKVRAYACSKRTYKNKYYKSRISFKGTGPVWNWCRVKYNTRRGAILTGKTAGNWVCLMKNGSHRPISVVDACKQEHGKAIVIRAKARDWNDPNSWECHVRK